MTATNTANRGDGSGHQAGSVGTAGFMVPAVRGAGDCVPTKRPPTVHVDFFYGCGSFRTIPAHTGLAAGL